MDQISNQFVLRYWGTDLSWKCNREFRLWKKTQITKMRVKYRWYKFLIICLIFAFYGTFSPRNRRRVAILEIIKTQALGVGLLSLSPTFTILDFLQLIFNTAGFHNQISFCFIYSIFFIYSLKTADILLRLQWFFHKNVLSGNLWRIKNKNQNGFPASLYSWWSYRIG